MFCNRLVLRTMIGHRGNLSLNLGLQSGIITRFSSNTHRIDTNDIKHPTLNEYLIRRATLRDVQKINNCNRRNLPENYENAFIANQILTWPSLSYVVEVDEDNIAGYALGKIEVDDSRSLHQQFHESVTGGPGETDNIKERIVSGHITSIAVEECFRRSGIGAALMLKMHKEMCQVSNLKSINLLCRVSNVAAIHHYSKVHGYICKRKLSRYYADGEDAWFMEWSK